VAIRNHGGARFDIHLDEWDQVDCSGILHLPEPYPADRLATHLRSNDYKGFLPLMPAASSTFYATDKGLVDLHVPGEPFTPRPHHSSPQLVEPSPRRPITAKPQNTLEPESTRPVLLTHNPPNRPEPHRQGNARALEDGACRYGCLPPAVPTHPQTPIRSPRPLPCAMRTNEPVRPPYPFKILSAGRFRPIMLVEFSECLRVRLHSHDHNM